MSLEHWISISAEDFRRDHFGKIPYAQPSTARNALPLLSWESVAEILAGQPPDVLVAKNGRALEQPLPRTAAALRTLLSEGGSVVVRKVEHLHAGIRQLAEDFGREVGGAATAHIFVTPKQTHTFGWHYDVEDVFILQTAGQKEYLLRQNTVNPHPTRANMPKDLGFEREKTPLAAATLLAGDWIYIPSGWWHVARCIEDSLSISVGVLRPGT